MSTVADGPPSNSAIAGLVSDHPLESSAADLLGFLPLVEGLARLLCHEDSKPPLSIAVTGPWGAGKSSLMKLLAAHLAERGFDPVWFNAWHHQKEESLLASLLENIRRQGVPPNLSWSGLVFRLRLLAIRARRHWSQVVLVLAVLALIAGYLLVDPVQRLEDLRQVAAHVARLELPSLEEATTPLALLVSAGVVLIACIKGFSTFLSNPARLLSSTAGGLGIRRFKSELGFRHKFAQEFRDVTNALPRRSIALLIDDLDRCRSQNVVEILESVNFLTTAGPCFVILGLDLTRVRHCVNQAFGEYLPAHGGKAAAEGKSEGDPRFADRYLEKILNLQLPLPSPTPEQYADLLGSLRARPAGRRTPWRQWPWRRWRAAAASGGLAVGLLIAFWAAGRWLGGLGRAHPGAEPPGADGGRLAQVAAWVVAGPSWWWLPSLAVLVAALILSVLWLRQRPRRPAPPSPAEFEEALNDWLPLVADRSRTPRSLKRFLNRVRLLDLLNRARVPGQDGNTAQVVPGPILVAFAAIGDSCPEWLEEPALWEDFVSFLHEQDDLPESLRRKIPTFSRWPRLGQFRDRLIHLLSLQMPGTS